MEEVTIKLNEREVGRVLNCIFTSYSSMEENKEEWFVKEVAYMKGIYTKIDNQMIECLTNKKGGNLC